MPILSVLATLLKSRFFGFYASSEHLPRGYGGDQWSPLQVAILDLLCYNIPTKVRRFL